MSSSLHANFNQIFCIVYFNKVVFNIHGQKSDILQVANFFIRNINFWSLRGNFSQRINLSQGRGGFVVLVQTMKSFLMKK